jgi:hypothetical protein
MRNILILLALLFSVSAIAQVHAYFMVTTTNTTVILSPNNSAHVIDTINIFISNSSEQQYIQDRAAVNPTIGDWEAALQISGIQEHIINPKLSIHSFTLLPGPLRYTSNGAIAYLTMDYYVNNVTMMSNIGPRKFKYIFNDSVFNFVNTASGEALPQNARLNIIIPKGASLISVYPLPDSPQSNFLGTFDNDTAFSWYLGEPLSKFSFSYVLSESPEQEIVGFFSGIYDAYAILIYLMIIAIAFLIVLYLYNKVSAR